MYTRLLLIATSIFLITTSAISKDRHLALQSESGIYGLYAGGELGDCVNGIAIDSHDNIIITGTTSSTKSIIGQGGFKSDYGGGQSDAFLIKYDSKGNIIWSTYFGGMGTDEGLSISITSGDRILICGRTNSSEGISAESGFQKINGGGFDGFIASFDSDGKIEWASYLGGVSDDEIKDLGIDSFGNIIIGGTTISKGLSTGNAFQKSLNGVSDAFIAKITTETSISWLTYFGGNAADTCKSLVIGNDNRIFIAGTTTSTNDLSSKGAYQDTLGGMTDGFISCFDSDGSRIWSTYIGGDKIDIVNDITRDESKNLLIAGTSQSRKAIATPDAFQGPQFLPNGGAVFIMRFTPEGSKYYGSYIAGSRSIDHGAAISCDPGGNYVLTGFAKGDIAASGGWQDTLGGLAGEFDAFAVKFNDSNDFVWSTYYGGSEADYGLCIANDKKNNFFIGGVTNSDDNISSINNLITPPDGFIAKLTPHTFKKLPFTVFDSAAYPITVIVRHWIDSLTYNDYIAHTFYSDSILDINLKEDQGTFCFIFQPLDSLVYQGAGKCYARKELINLSLLEMKGSFLRTNISLDSNSKGNISLIVSDNGIFGYDADKGVGGLYWPRGTDNQYIFGGGIWIGARKWNSTKDTIKKMAIMSFNPNSGNSWMIPGRYEDQSQWNPDLHKKYPLFKSVDYDHYSGVSLVNTSQPSWPLWKQNASLELSKFGAYVFDNNRRNRDIFIKGPAFFADEDLFLTFKDDGLQFYEGNQSYVKTAGYPIGIQFECNLYCWDDEPMKDAFVLSYKIINTSKDTLLDVWLAPVIDYDIAVRQNSSYGAANDRGRFYFEEDSLQMAAGWTMTDRGEADKNFGYVGFSLIQTPAIDSKGFLRKDKDYYIRHEQLGLKTYRNWVIEEDLSLDTAVYNYISSGVKDADAPAGDRRALLGSGPFNMLPGDTAKLMLLINFAPPALASNADGSAADMEKLVMGKKNVDKFLEELILGIKDQSTNSEFAGYVYPNPTNGLTKIQVNSDIGTNVNVLVYNLSGEAVPLKFMVRSDENDTQEIILNFSSLPPSVYYILIKIPGQTLVKKVQVY